MPVHIAGAVLAMLTLAIVVRAAARCVRAALHPATDPRSSSIVPSATTRPPDSSPRVETILTSDGPRPPDPRARRRLLGITGAAATVTVTVGLIAHPASDLLLALAIIAYIYFVFPLAHATWVQDHTVVADLMTERRQSATILIITAAKRLVTALAALCASLYILPIAFAGYILFWLDIDQQSDSRFLVLCMLVLLVALAWFCYPFAAGYLEAAARPAVTPRGRFAKRLAMLVRWGGRRVTSGGTTLYRSRVRFVPLLAGVVAAAALVVGTLAIVPLLAKANAFEEFRRRGFDTDYVAVSVAAAVIVVLDLFAWLRARIRTPVQAVLLLVATFVVGVAGSVLTDVVAATDREAYATTPSVLAGLCFGVFVAAAVEFAQTIAAGAVAMQRLSGEPMYAELSRGSALPYGLGVTTGTRGWTGLQRELSQIRERAAKQVAETPRRRLLEARPEHGLEPLLGYRGMPLARALCVCALPIALVWSATFGVPDGGLLLAPWGLLVIMGFISFAFYFEILWMWLLREERR